MFCFVRAVPTPKDQPTATNPQQPRKSDQPTATNQRQPIYNDQPTTIHRWQPSTVTDPQQPIYSNDSDRPTVTNPQQPIYSTNPQQPTGGDQRTATNPQQPNFWLGQRLAFGDEICNSAANVHLALFHNSGCGRRPKGAGNLGKAPSQFWESGSLSRAEKEERTEQMSEPDKGSGA